MVDTAREQEVWKTYPEFPFIEVSNFGRVRTKDRYVRNGKNSKRLVKGRILKQQLNKKGYMYVHINVNGKIVNRYVHRMVAVCFLPNPNGLPEVNHKDNDRTNNAVSNLEWCTSQYNLDYKKNFGTSPAQVQGRSVFAVDLNNGRVLRFETRSEAMRQLGVNTGDISRVLKGKLNQIRGYWFTEDESEITEEKIREIKANMKPCQVIAVNPKTSEVLWFESYREAGRQLGIDYSLIGKVVMGKQHKTHGWWFCYADEIAVDKIITKFGDKIAE